MRELKQVLYPYDTVLLQKEERVSNIVNEYEREYDRMKLKFNVSVVRRENYDKVKRNWEEMEEEEKFI